MITEETINDLANKMLERRRQALDFRNSLKSSRQNLQERENELGELAGKETMLEGVEKLDNLTVDELRKIDEALANIESGTYGRCNICNRPIAAKRLRAIPWTTVCKRCAQEMEAPQPGPETEDVSDTEMTESDDDIVQIVWDALDAGEELEINRMEVTCDNGTIHLTGTLPTEREHQMVLEVVQEDLGYEDVIDRIDIESLQERFHEGEEEPFEAEQESRSMVPTDRLRPGNDRKRSKV